MEKRYLICDDDDTLDEQDRQYYVLLIYDIIDNKRRRNMVKIAEAFGVRVQKSAFECKLDKKRYDRLLKRAPRCINHEEDSLRIYLLNGRASVMTWGCETNLDSDRLIIL